MQKSTILLVSMDWCVLSLLLLMLGKNGLSLQEEVCSKSVITSCKDCITSGPFCSWCQQLDFTKAGEQEAVRCDTQAKLMARGCKSQDIISPQNNEEIQQKDPLSQSSFDSKEPVQMTPQKIRLILRPGLPHKFNVSFKRAEGYPVDLYYLMDLSYSMKDDLANVKKLGGNLFDALNKITKHAKIGFGAFVDKTVLPYTNTNEEKLKKPCDENENQCQAAFGFRHVLSMTPSREAFTQKVTEQFISGNLDSPEGSLDAMMQAAVCEDKIGWRNNSTRLIVLATDAGFHMAGDGKLAGILEPNDELCHMKDSLYVKSNEMDYPSVGQLAMQLEKNNIQPIFAVTDNVKDVYRELTKMIPKSVVGVLSSDSNNVVQLIESAYKNLTSKVTVTHDILPDNVRVEYLALCDHRINESPNKGVCDQVQAEQQISFEVTVTVDKCMTEKSFTISPLGIKDKLTVTVSTNCECQCNDRPGSNHPHCNNTGSITCGICTCNKGFVGQFCNCAVGNKDEGSIRASCRRQNGTECEGRGDCVCGRCQCHTTEQGSSYHGNYCECDDEHCEKYENKLCAGHGKCNCGRCQCEKNYQGTACQCKLSEDGCRAPDNSVCYGRGNCICNQCECIEGYHGPHCKECSGCTSVCLTKLSCISCLGLSQKENKLQDCNHVCNNSISKYEKVEKFSLQSKECHQKDSEGCWIKFKLDQLTGKDNYSAEILIKKECPEPPSVIAIIGGSLAAVAVIGILLLMLVKLLIHMKDLKEFKKFENEKKKSKWANADNPLFQNPTTTVANPLFTGE